MYYVEVEQWLFINPNTVHFLRIEIYEFYSEMISVAVGVYSDNEGVWISLGINFCGLCIF